MFEATHQVLALLPDGAPDGDIIQPAVHHPGHGLLVLSEIYYPGWQASPDGAAVPLIRADGLLRGVLVHEGQHTVRVWYAPANVRVGLVISALGLVFSLGGWLVANRHFPS